MSRSAAGTGFTALLVVGVISMSFVSSIGTNLAHADQAIDEMHLQGTPFSVAVDPGSNRIYVTNFALDGMLYTIDAGTNQVRTMHVGMFPIAVATDNSTNTVYVLNYADSTISEINATSMSTLATVPTIRYPGSFAVNPATHKLYVGGVNSLAIAVMSGGTPDINYISEDCGPAYAIAVNPVTGMVYVTTSFGGFGGSPFGCVLAIDGSTDMIVQRILLGRQAYPGALSIDTKSNTVYVADSVRPVIYVIDGSSNAQSGVINLASPYVSSMAIDTSTSKLFASHSLSSSVSEVDMTTGLLISEIPVPGRLVCLGVNAMTHTVYVTDYQGELAAFQA